MTWPQPTRKDHDTFCRVERWRQVRDARGRTGTHRVTYELDLSDGRILRTRISHPVDRTDYGRRLWQHILRDQLEVAEGVFWSCVHDGVKPQRDMPRPPRNSLPADLVHLLISRVGLTGAEVSVMSREDAIDRVRRYWTEGR